MTMHNVFAPLAGAFDLIATNRRDPRLGALAKTIAEAHDACQTEGVDLYADDLAEGLRSLVRLAPCEEIPDSKRRDTIREMLDQLYTLTHCPVGPRGTPAQHLRQCAAAWQAMVDAQNDQDPRGASIAQRWSKEARILERAAAEPRVLYIAKEADKSGMLIYGRIHADHDFTESPAIVIHTDQNLVFGSAVGTLPPEWMPLIDHAAAIRSAVYDRQHAAGSVLARLKGGMPSGVIAHAEVLELMVRPDEPALVFTHYGAAGIPIAEIVEAAVGRRFRPEAAFEKLRAALDGITDAVPDTAWSDGLTADEWTALAAEQIRVRFGR